MKRPEPDTPAARERSAAAANWLVKRDRGLTAAEQDEYSQWLATDARHGEWLAVHRRTVGNFDCLAQWRPEHSEESNPDLLARSPLRWRWLAPAMLAAAATVAVAFVWWRGAPDEHDENTPGLVAAQEQRILEDGSAIALKRGAVVSVAFTGAERRVTLTRGEALFTVTSNPDRPFIVRAGGVDVRAVGTAFNVRLDAAAMEVLVTEGSVELQQPAATPGDSPSSKSMRVEPQRAAPVIAAGQRATVSLQQQVPPEIVSVTPEETARLLAWQPQLLDFSSAPLGRAIEEFNRRNRVRFVIADPEVAAMPIVASVRSDNVLGFTRLLATTPGLEIEHRGELEIVIRRKR